MQFPINANFTFHLFNIMTHIVSIFDEKVTFRLVNIIKHTLRIFFKVWIPYKIKFHSATRVQEFYNDFCEFGKSVNKIVLIFQQNLNLMKILLFVFFHNLKHIGRIGV